LGFFVELVHGGFFSVVSGQGIGSPVQVDRMGGKQKAGWGILRRKRAGAQQKRPLVAGVVFLVQYSRL
jgi:hypothetical protein